jgi:hypothetical protein
MLPFAPVARQDGIAETRKPPSGRYAISQASPHTTQTATSRGHSGHDIAILEGAAFRARFVMRLPEKAT